MFGIRYWMSSRCFAPGRRPALQNLFATRLGRRNFGEVGRQLIGLERFHTNRDQGGEGHAEIYRAVGAVHNRGHPGKVAAVRADDVNGLLHAAALGHHILDDQNLFIGRNFESAPQDQFFLLLLGEDEPDPELPGDLLTDDQPAQRRGDDGDRAERPGLGRQGVPELLDDGHLLERQGALEKLPAVQAAAEDEMTFEQRSAVAKNLEDFVLCHGGMLSPKFKVQSSKLAGRVCGARLEFTL